MSEKGNIIFEFNDFRLDQRERYFARGSERIQITDKAFEVLRVLLEHSRSLVTKDELLAEVWADSFVEENTLDKNISTLRHVFEARDPGVAYIETVRGRGYRFLPDVVIAVRDTKPAFAQNGDLPSVELSAAEVREPAPAAEQRSSTVRKTSTRWVWLSVIGILIVGLAAFAILRSRTSGGIPSGKRLAVLPLVNSTGDQNAEFLSDGITDGVTDDLSRLSGLEVVSRNSAFRFRSDQSDVRKIANTLAVDTLVTGDVKRLGDKYVIDIRLIDGKNDSQLWANQYVRSSTDIMTAQSEIAKDIANNLRLGLRPFEIQAATSRSTQNNDAYQLYLLGRYHASKATEDSLKQAIALYRRALDADPNYALAYAGIARCSSIMAFSGWTMKSSEAMEQTREAATRALDLDPNLAAAHASLGWVDYVYLRDWKAAEQEYRKAIGLGPNDAEIHASFAHMLSVEGRSDEAVSEAERSVDLDPVSLMTNTLYAQALFFAGRTDQAIKQTQKVFEIEPNFWIARNLLGRIDVSQGRYAEALTEFENARAHSGIGSIVPITEIGYTHAKMGDRAGAEQAIADLRASRRYVPFYSYAAIYNGLGDREKALDSLERSVAEHEADAVFIKVNGRWNDYADDPRFKIVLQQLRL